MKFFYYILAGLVLFIIRQFTVPLWGGWSDIFFIVPPIFIWLWLEDDLALIIMITTSVLLDVMLSRVLPFYTLATITAWAAYYWGIMPYLSHNTQLTRILVFIVWLILWRSLYIVWLLIGWFADAPPLDLEQPIIWPLVGWFILSFFLLGLMLSTKWLVTRYLKRLRH